MRPSMTVPSSFSGRSASRRLRSCSSGSSAQLAGTSPRGIGVNYPRKAGNFRGYRSSSALRTRRLLAHDLSVNDDLDLVADRDAAGLEQLIPRQPEVAALDFRRGFEPRALTAPGVLRAPMSGDIEHHLACDIANGQITNELEAISGHVGQTTALESQGRKRFRVEEIC